MSCGFASDLRFALPNASFIDLTDMPIENSAANTSAVLAVYVCIGDIQFTVADKAAVPIYFESRVPQFSLNAAELPEVDLEWVRGQGSAYPVALLVCPTA